MMGGVCCHIMHRLKYISGFKSTLFSTEWREDKVYYDLVSWLCASYLAAATASDDGHSDLGVNG